MWLLHERHKAVYNEPALRLLPHPLTSESVSAARHRGQPCQQGGLQSVHLQRWQWLVLVLSHGQCPQLDELGAADTATCM